MKSPPRIVVLGGGTGTFTVLSGLKRFPVSMTAVVSMSDNGGSTGILRDELGVLPPGDIRQCLVALSEGDEMLRRLFNYRFADGSLAGHNFGNLFLSVLELLSGDPLSAVREAQRILNVRGNVIPVSATASHLHAELRDGSLLVGEHAIDEAVDARAGIERCFLKPRVNANPDAIEALQTADLIIIGPGDLYTSLVPVLLVDGITDALAASPAQIVYILNLVTKQGQTDGYTGRHHCDVIEQHVYPARLDTVLVNQARLPDDLQRRYKDMSEFPVLDDFTSETRFRVHREDLLAGEITLSTTGDRLRRSLLRHDSDKLAKAILRLV